MAVGRNAGKLKPLADKGVNVREAEYSKAETLQGLFQSGDKVLLVSSSEVGLRLKQHSAVIDAAKNAGVRLLAYTSILRADTSTVLLAPEHKATEAYLRESGLPFVMLRNGWYLENQKDNLAPALEHGAILGAAGEGRFSFAARADYAAAASAVLTTDGHENKAYELGGDQSYTLADVAAEVAEQSGKTVVYQDLPEEKYAEVLVSFGLPEPVAKAVADGDIGGRRGELETDSKDLSTLIKRPTTTLQEAVRTALSK